MNEMRSGMNANLKLGGFAMGRGKVKWAANGGIDGGGNNDRVRWSVWRVAGWR